MLRKASFDPTPTPSTLGDNASLYAESSTPTSPTRSLRHMSSTSSLLNATSSFSHLPTDIGFYFSFHKHKITCCHYMLKADHCDFLHTVLLEEASKSECLMYAVAAFSSLRYTAGMKDGRFQTFLEYYNTAVTKLRETLGNPPTLATLLTILQLASFEVRLLAVFSEHLFIISRNTLGIGETLSHTGTQQPKLLKHYILRKRFQLLPILD